jgi:hypothetical protein
MPTVISTDHSRTAIPTSPPANWEREVPRYRVGRDVRPSPNDRHRHEPPFSSFSDGSVWQQADRPHEAGEIIESTEWPHPMFFPLNYSARQVLNFFNSSQKSRLPRAPWADGRVRLSDGLSGPLPTIKAPQPEPVRLQPRQAWPDM